MNTRREHNYIDQDMKIYAARMSPGIPGSVHIARRLGSNVECELPENVSKDDAKDCANSSTNDRYKILERKECNKHIVIP